MNARLFVAALVVVGLPMIAIAAAQDPGDPGSNLPGDEEPSTPGEETAFDEAFLVLDENACPIEDGFEPALLEGSTSWTSQQHPRADEDCVAQWGDGTYERGSKAALEATEIPTRHLAASNAPSRTVNDAARTLIENGVDPQIAAPLLSGFADGCETAYAAESVTSGDTTDVTHSLGDFCRDLVQTSHILLDVPDVPAGAGALYLDLSHAYDFTQPDENQIAPDGAWVEARTPGEDYERLRPVSMYGPSEDGHGTLCTLSGPMTVILDRYTSDRELGSSFTLSEIIALVEDQYRDVAPDEVADETPSVLDVIPTSEQQWREDCGGVVDQTYASTLQASEDSGDEAGSSSDPPLQRFAPYPGTVRGEGSGFVGSTVDETGEPQFVEHWFDLSRYAGETVEIRFAATGGAGLGTQEGGWWIDHSNLRYTGPPDDLSVRVGAPEDGDVLPSGSSAITANGTVPVEAVVENLGRTTSQPATVQVSLAGATESVAVPELDPLESYRATALLPAPSDGEEAITAELARPVPVNEDTPTPVDEETSSVVYTDSFPENNEDTVEVSFDSIQDVELDILEVQSDGPRVNLTVEVENEGNEPATVPLEATLTPVDLSTRSPRSLDAHPQGLVDTLLVPHGDEMNTFGVSDPTRTTNVELEIPSQGVWEVSLASQDHDQATATTVVPFEEATPTAVQNALGSVLSGPTDEVPRGGFELVGETDDLDEQAAFLEDLQHPIDGPETRFVPIGQAAMASSGEALPEEWSPVRGENPAAWGNASIGGEDKESCEVEAEVDESTDLGGQVINPQLDFVSNWLTIGLCTANDLNETAGVVCDVVGEDPCPADSVPEDPMRFLERELGVRSPNEARVPASLQTWNVRQNHVTIYGVGTDASSSESMDAIDDLHLEEDGDRVYLEFRHAGKLHWENERGAKAQVAIVPGGQIDLVEQMREAENQTRALTQDTGLPPEGQALVNTLLMDVFFQTVIQNTPDTHVPQDVCAGVGNAVNAGEDVALVDDALSTFCGDAQAVEAVEGACEGLPGILGGTVEECDFTEHAGSTFLHQSGGTEEEGTVVEWTEPVGWDTERIDVTDIVDQTTREDGLDEGFYVMFNLVTTSDLDEFLTSVSADAPGEGDQARVNNDGSETGVQRAESSFGWERGEVPVWTVNEPRLERTVEDNDEPKVRWCLNPNPDREHEDVAECEVETTLRPSDMRGWETFWLEDSAPTAWEYEQRGGDPTSAAPSALVWEGGSGELIETHDGLRTAMDQDQPDPYSVLSGPVVDVSGYEKPVVEMNVQWGETEAGVVEYGEDDESLESLETRCEEESDTAEDSHVWAWTGWNVRVRPVHEDGSLGEAETVEPVGGYHECETENDVEIPVLFNGEGVFRAPPSYESSLAWQGTGPIESFDSNQFAGGDCSTGLAEATDPARFCREAELAFGHEEPVFAFPMSGWNDVAFDLSQFRGQTVQVEVHAFGLMAETQGHRADPVPRGELRVDSFKVSEGNPPFDVNLDHDGRSFIAPSTGDQDVDERFEIEIENRGSEPVDSVDVRRTVVGPDGCQVVEPAVEPWTLLDPETGQPGLPPGEEATIRNPKLAWIVPDDEGEIYERRLTVETGGSLEPSLAPEAFLQINEDGSVATLFVDDDDCADDVDLSVTEFTGDAQVDEGDTAVTVEHDDEDDVETPSSIKVQATDTHGVESRPAYVTPVPAGGLRDPVPGFSFECSGLACEFDASELTRDPSDVIEEYRWDFGDESHSDEDEPPNGASVEHEYEEADRYNVELTVVWEVDERERTESVSERITVNEDDVSGSVPGDDAPNAFELLGLSPEGEVQPGDVPDEGATEVDVLQSATTEQGDGSAVEISVDKPRESMFTRLVLPCETGDRCQDNMIGVVGFDEVVLRDLAPGHYLGYVMFGNEFGFSPVEFTVGLEPESGSDARPSDNTVTLRSELREDPSVRVESIEVPKLLPVGEEVELDIKVTNDGNVPLEDVTTDVHVLPFDLRVEADRIQRLDPGDTRTAQATVDLPRPGPATVSVETTVASDADEPISAEKGSGIVVVDRHQISATSGDHENWDVDDEIRFGDGIRVPSNVNEMLPLLGQMDTASSPFSLLEANVSGSLEQSYDGFSIEWRPADAEVDAQGNLVDEDPIEPQAYRLPGENLVPLFESGQGADRLGTSCDPFVDTSDIATQEVPIQELSNPETYACRELPLGSSITASHAGGTPGELTPAVTGSPTLDLPGVDTQKVRTSASDLPSTEKRTVDTITASDWDEMDQMGGFLLEEGDDILDGSNAFYFPTGTLSDQAGQHYAHELRVPLTVGEWCQLTTEMVPERTPLRVITDERRVFANDEVGTSGWDVNVRLETGEKNLGLLTTTVVGDSIVDLEDPTTTRGQSLEYDLPLGPLFGIATQDPVPLPKSIGSDWADTCSGLEEKAEDPNEENVRDELSKAEIVLELSSETGPNEDALDVGWFVGSLEVPALGIEVGASDSNYEARPCDQDSLPEDWAPGGGQSYRTVYGCTEIATSGQPLRGSLYDSTDDSDSWTQGGLVSTERLQSVALSGSSATNDAGENVTLLKALRSERPLEVGEPVDLYRNLDEKPDVLTTHPDSYEFAGEDWFRYVDAVALVDLRAGLDGEVYFDVDADNGDEVVAQVVAAPLEPGEAFGEQAPARVDWTPLNVYQAQTPSLTYPSTPLGAEDRRIVGPLSVESHDEPVGDQDELCGEELAPEVKQVSTASATTLNAKSTLCADISPVGGEVAMIGVRLWMPTQDANVEIGEGAVDMQVPDAQQLVPRLRAMTDDTVHEGTLTVHDVSILSMPPSFSHNVDVAFDEPVDWDHNVDPLFDHRTALSQDDAWEDERVLASNTTPSFTIDVDQPARKSSWEIDVNVSFEVTVSEDAETPVQSGTYAGELDLPESSYEGSQEIDVSWQLIRESIDAYKDDTDPERVWNESLEWLDWLEEEPVLPSGDISVDAIGVDVETHLDSLEDPVDGCPSSLEELAESTDVTCRQLATVVDEGRESATAAATERSLLEGAGVRNVTVTPDRANLDTERTAELELANPTSLPVSLNGTLTLTTWDETVLEEVEIPETSLDPWTEEHTISLDLPPVPGEHLRVIAEASVGDTTASDDYRTTTAHENGNMFSAGFNEGASGVQRTAEASKPDLPGQTGDAFGWRLEASGGQRSITPLATDEVDAGDLYEMLQEDEDPLLVFQHQRDLVNDASSASEGDYSYLGASLCPGTSEPNEGNSCVLLEDAWAPEPADTMNEWEQTNNQDATWDGCTQTGEDQSDPNLVAYGIDGPDTDVIGDSTGVIRPSVLSEWETAAFEIPESAIDEVAVSEDWPVHFRIFIGECSTDKSSTVVVDDVGIASARPQVRLGAEEAPIWPGSEKRYPFTLENHGAGSDTFHVTPSQEIPEGWHVSVDVEGDTVFDTRAEDLEPVEVAQDETLEGVARIQAPPTARGAIEELPLTAYATHAPGLMSSGATNASIEDYTPDEVDEDDQLVADPGGLTLRTEGVDLPNLVVQEDTITVENAEIGRETKLQFQIVNEGRQRAEDVPIVVAVRGPSGFETLESPGGEDPVRETVQPGATTTLTYSWSPREPGEHTLRVVADPDPGDIGLLLEDEVERFFGLAQETHECTPEACPNLVDHAFRVEPLQQPDLRLSVDGVPDRIGIGEETQLTVAVENVGGRAATDATLRLSENGLLPILDSMTVDLPRIEPAEQETITTTWAPVSPGEGLVLGSVEGPDVYTGQRPDGSRASEDSEVAIRVFIDRPDVDATLSEPIRTEPGTSHAVLLNVTNDGTAPVEILPETVQRDGVYLSPVVNTPVEVAPGAWETVPVLGFAEIGTLPTSQRLPVPLSQGEATATVHVLGAPDARVVLDEAPLEPGTTELDALVSNRGNVPLDDELRVRGDGIRGSADIDVAPGESANVTVPVTVQPRVDPGNVNVATHATTTDDGRVTQVDRITVDAAPAADFGLRADAVPLTGSASGELVVRNVGNMPLDGRVVLEGPVTLEESPMLDLDPAESTVLPVTWVSGTDRNGTATVETLDGDRVGSAELVPSDVSPSVEISNVGTSPSVNLAEGMVVQVVGTVENTGPVPLENHTLGVTVDGELYQTFEIDDVRPGEVTTASQELELPKSGEITLGLVDLAAFQRGETAGAAVTVTADEAALGLGAALEIPDLSVLGVVLTVGVAAGVRSR